MKLHPVATVLLGCGLILLPVQENVVTLPVFANASISISDSDSVVTPVDGNRASVEAVAAHLEGIMGTERQAEGDSNFVGVRMTTCRVVISSSQPDSIYLYQEQALIENLDSPYRQRFLQIAPGENQRVDSLTFKPENSHDWIGLCTRPNPTVSLDDLGEVACTISLRAASIGGFVGSTPAEGCPASVRGAVKITNVVVLHEAGMDTWDRGFDEQGNQVWGAQDIPYRYRR